MLEEELRLLRFVADELLLPDDLEEDRTVERELLRLPFDRTDEPDDRLLEDRPTLDDLLTRVLTVFDIVFLIRFEILDPLLRVLGSLILLLTLDTALWFDRTLTFPVLILLLILSIDCCLAVAGFARFTFVRSRLL